MSVDLFDEIVFKKMSSYIRKTRRVGYSEADFSRDVIEASLNFDKIKQKDPKVKIFQTLHGYDIRLSKPHIAFDLHQYLKEDNQDCDFMFTPELLEFEPEEDLVRKSKFPLWIICPIKGGNRVIIKRAW